MIAVIDYKAGNITSVVRALRFVGAETEITADPETVRRADKVVLPGVGHFAATRALREAGLDSAIRDSMAQGAPFLGICVGLQWLFEGSTEADDTDGLGTFPGRCERFSGKLKVPHVGWNSIAIDPASRILQGLENESFVYFTHSFYAPVVKDTTAVTTYGGPFSAAVERGNIFGIQFHPEKSAGAGLQVLRNFVEFKPTC